MGSRSIAPLPVRSMSAPSSNGCAVTGRAVPKPQERLSVDGDGLVVLELKRAFSDGTTRALFEPQDFSRSCAPCAPCARDISASVHVIARLAALVPRPKAHLVRYHGLFAPNARDRAAIVARSKVASMAGDRR